MKLLVLLLWCVFNCINHNYAVAQSNTSLNDEIVAIQSSSSDIDIFLNAAILDYTSWHDSLIGVEGFLAIRFVAWNDTIIKVSLKKIYAKIDMEHYSFDGVKTVNSTEVFVSFNDTLKRQYAKHLRLKSLDIQRLHYCSSSVEFFSYRVYSYHIQSKRIEVLNCLDEFETCREMEDIILPFRKTSP